MSLMCDIEKQYRLLTANQFQISSGRQYKVAFLWRRATDTTKRPRNYGTSDRLRLWSHKGRDFVDYVTAPALGHRAASCLASDCFSI